MGEAVRNSGIPREEIFVITKLYPNQFSNPEAAIEEGFVTREEIFVTTKMWTDDYGNGEAAIDASLERLELDYIDACVILGTS